MNTTKKDAVERFKSGYNCCQAVICNYCEELGMKEEEIFRLTEAFGTGMGGLKDTCGAVSGMFMAISLANCKSTFDDPKASKEDTYAKIQEAAEKFKKQHHSLYCRDLLNPDQAVPRPCCIKCVEDASAILDEMLNK